MLLMAIQCSQYVRTTTTTAFYTMGAFALESNGQSIYAQYLTVVIHYKREPSQELFHMGWVYTTTTFALSIQVLD